MGDYGDVMFAGLCFGIRKGMRGTRGTRNDP